MSQPSKTSRLLLVAAVLIGSAPSLLAQGDGGPDPAQVRVRFGPLWANPTISLTNIGVDKNVFNEPDQQVPKSDFTFTITPRTDLWLRVGRTWLAGVVNEDIVWYKTYSSERSVNSSVGLSWKVPLNHVSFAIGAKHNSTRARPGFEIDARAQRAETPLDASAELRVLSKTYFGVTWSYLKTDFDTTDVFAGINLRETLNRKDIITGLSVRHQLTPLTSIAFSGEREDITFEFSPIRNSTATNYVASVKFDPAALLKGSASFGWQDFTPADPSLPGFKGSTANVDLGYTFAGFTKVGVTASRGVNYSYDIAQPYYVLTGATANASQQIFGPIDAVGTIGVQRLDYRDRAGFVVKVSNRTDYVHTYGGGLGYHMGRDVRFGFNISNSTRTSAVDARQYNGLHYGFAVTYGS